MFWLRSGYFITYAIQWLSINVNRTLKIVKACESPQTYVETWAASSIILQTKIKAVVWAKPICECDRQLRSIRVSIACLGVRHSKTMSTSTGVAKFDIDQIIFQIWFTNNFENNQSKVTGLIIIERNVNYPTGVTYSPAKFVNYFKKSAAHNN